MKKVLLTVSLLALMTGCEPNTKEATKMKYIDKVSIGDVGFGYEFEDRNGEKIIYLIDKDDDVFVEKGGLYDLEITKNSLFYNSSYIQKAERSAKND